MNKKYELIKSKYIVTNDGVVLYRIKALKDFGDVKAGDIGGYIESENNLSHDGDCWIYNDAIAKDRAKVLDNAIIKDYAYVSNKAIIAGNSKVYDHSIVIGDATVNGTSEVYGYATVGSGTNLNHAIKIYAFDSVNGIVDASNNYNYTSVLDRDAILTECTVCGSAIIDGGAYLGKNAFITTPRDYVRIFIGISLAFTFYLSKDKDIYFTFDNCEYKLSDFEETHKNISSELSLVIEFAKNYLLKEREEDE